MCSIDKQKSEIRRRFLNPLNCKELSEFIHSNESKRDRPDGPFQRDYSRIMYASSFRRLQGKMQLLGIKEDQFFRNRLTHSLEVAQIARSLAFEVGYEQTESFVVEAGALAHDIGNPPFGHSGEAKLNELFRDIGGFEGNAQTLRILTSIEKKKPEFNGLNLTYRTLLSVVKYFKQYDKTQDKKKKQKFIYDEDYNVLKSFIDANEIAIRTLDVQIVDLSDEIAYAAHDLEDGLRQGCYTIEEILHDYNSQYGDTESYNKLKDIVEECRKAAGYGDSKIDSSQYSKMFRQELSSKIIYTLIHDVALVEVSNEKKLKTGTLQEEELDFVKYKEMADGLKKITFKCINHKDEVYFYEENGNIVIEGLVKLYKKYTRLLPPEYRVDEINKKYGINAGNASEEKLQQRLICDYISGMMDSYAISTYEKYKDLLPKYSTKYTILKSTMLPKK